MVASVCVGMCEVYPAVILTAFGFVVEVPSITVSLGQWLLLG